MYVLSIYAYNIGINIEAFQFMKSIASPMLNSLMAALSQSFLVVLPLIALYMFLKKDRNVYVFSISVILFYIVNDTLKYIVREPRPCNTPELSWINSVGCETNYSFPSSHAAVLTGLPAFMGKFKYVRAVYLIWLALILFGRIYLGEHYLTDVIAGMLLSTVMAYLIYKFRNRINDFAGKIIKKVIPQLYV
ncbi:MAG: phosphatase PAP2 family protein [Candidatus Micrarchaeia archaeon]